MCCKVLFLVTSVLAISKFVGINAKTLVSSEVTPMCNSSTFVNTGATSNSTGDTTIRSSVRNCKFFLDAEKDNRKTTGVSD